MASTGLKNSKVLKEFAIKKRTQLWQYLNVSIDRFLRDLGLRTTTTLVEGATSDWPCQVTKCGNETYVRDGVTYDVWKHCGRGVLQASDAIVDGGTPGVQWVSTTELGTINVSKGAAIEIIADSSLVEAADGLSTVDRTPLANDASFVGGGTPGSASQFVQILYLTIYNDSAPITENWVRVAAVNNANYDGYVYTDFKFIVEQGATVSITVA
tara:strand:+ start:1348 stop:1983 length:636 start_codon:yes stop_codon:yes gene_type:complete